MFDILFRWRKASRCKKLIKTVRCRLKLLKNKRLCIVNQLRDDVAQLLTHGHHHTALQRVEQVVVDENVVQLYDLLDQFCEFILLNMSYIRKQRDCPNDINEAASTLIFSSARFGELPELQPIRKLFGERYGQRFVANALELLPGNLVNRQIKESLYTKKVGDEVKYRLLDDIANSCIQTGPLFLEYKPLLQANQAKKGTDGISCNEVQQLQLCIEGRSEETEGEIIMSKQVMKNDTRLSCHDESCSSETSSAKLPEEIVYLDDIEEFVSKDGNRLQDQRLFVFKLKERRDYEINADHEQSPISWRKMKKGSRKRTRTRTRSRSSLSQGNRSFKDVEYASYYGEPKDDHVMMHNEEKIECDQLQLCKYSETGEQGNYYMNEGAGESTAMVPSRATSMGAGKEIVVRDVMMMNRSNTYPFHIHPKLPDYDELAAKFMQLKTAALNKQI